jgi:uncharacterized protein (DUF305 family)
MKKLLFVLLILLAGCANKEEYQKCKKMRLETADLIAKTDLIIKEQQAKIDSMNKITIEWIASSGSRNNSVSMWGLENETHDAYNVKGAMSTIKIYLGSIYFHYGIIAKASTRFGYLFKGKQEIIKINRQVINEEISVINQVTGGLSAKEYIYKYLPKN